MRPHAILETALYADDLAAAEGFYTGVLGLAVITREPERHVFFRCGAGVLLVFDPRASATHESIIDGTTVPTHGAHGPGHVAFAVAETELDAWRRRLAEHACPIETTIAWPNGGVSIYFRDPAGNSVELATPRLWGLDGPAPSGD